MNYLLATVRALQRVRIALRAALRGRTAGTATTALTFAPIPDMNLVVGTRGGSMIDSDGDSSQSVTGAVGCGPRWVGGSLKIGGRPHAARRLSRAGHTTHFRTISAHRKIDYVMCEMERR